MADQAALEKYFAPPKGMGGPLKVIGAGVLILLIAMAASSGMMMLLGLLVAAAGGYWLYQNKQGSGLSDSEVQQVIDQAARPALQDALNRFGLVEESLIADPVVLTGPNFNGPAKKGTDDEWRTAKNFVNVLLFTEKSLHLYTHRFDILKPTDKSGTTEEYFYRHIVSVSTSEQEFTVRDGENSQTIREDTLMLRNSGGEPITMSAYNSNKLNSAVQSARSVIQERQD